MIFQIFESPKISGHLCQAGLKPESVGIDTWGVDFGSWVRTVGIGIPFAYRDPHTNNHHA
jgi:rhamnulokinase